METTFRNSLKDTQIPSNHDAEESPDPDTPLTWRFKLMIKPYAMSFDFDEEPLYEPTFK